MILTLESYLLITEESVSEKFSDLLQATQLISEHMVSQSQDSEQQRRGIWNPDAGPLLSLHPPSSGIPVASLHIFEAFNNSQCSPSKTTRDHTPAFLVLGKEPCMNHTGLLWQCWWALREGGSCGPHLALPEPSLYRILPIISWHQPSRLSCPSCPEHSTGAPY